MRKKIFGLLAVVMFAVSVALCILDATVLETNAVHPLLLFVGALALLEGLLLSVYAFVAKSGFSLLSSSVILALASLYFYLDFASKILVTVAILMPIAIIVIFIALAFVFGFRGTRIDFDNDGTKYKTYRERKKEKEE